MRASAAHGRGPIFELATVAMLAFCFCVVEFCGMKGWRENEKCGKAYITEGSRVVSYLNTNSARWCLTSLFEMGRGGSTIV